MSKRTHDGEVKPTLPAMPEHIRKHLEAFKGDTWLDLKVAGSIRRVGLAYEKHNDQPPPTDRWYLVENGKVVLVTFLPWATWQRSVPAQSDLTIGVLMATCAAFPQGE